MRHTEWPNHTYLQIDWNAETKKRFLITEEKYHMCSLARFNPRAQRLHRRAPLQKSVDSHGGGELCGCSEAGGHGQAGEPDCAGAGEASARTVRGRRRRSGRSRRKRGPWGRRHARARHHRPAAARLLVVCCSTCDKKFTCWNELPRIIFQQKSHCESRGRDWSFFL